MKKNVVMTLRGMVPVIHKQDEFIKTITDRVDKLNSLIGGKISVTTDSADFLTEMIITVPTKDKRVFFISLSNGNLKLLKDFMTIN